MTQKNKTIVETSQKITSMMAKNVSVQNSEITQWISYKKDQDRIVYDRISKASQVIGSCLHVLSEISFVHPYAAGSPNDPDRYLELLEKRLNRIQQKPLQHVDADTVSESS